MCVPASVAKPHQASFFLSLSSIPILDKYAYVSLFRKVYTAGVSFLVSGLYLVLKNLQSSFKL